MKRVILVNPHHEPNWDYKGGKAAWPIHLLYLGTALSRGGYEPLIVDTCKEPNYKEKIKRSLQDCLYVGISAMTPQVRHGMEIARFIKGVRAEVPVIWGGIHPTLFPESCRSPYCDAAAMGEGDQTVVELAEVYEGKKALEDVAGICFMKEGRPFQTMERKPADMSELPFPDYSLIDLESYINSYVIQLKRKSRIVPVHAARGCPWRCSFCINTTVNETRKHRKVPVGRLLDEIEFLKREYDAEGIMLQDEEFFADRSYFYRFLEGIETRNIKVMLYATCRVNHFRKSYISSELLERMKECGFTDLVFGIESGSERALKIIRKDITLNMVRRTVDLLKDTGIHAVYGFIAAIPGETKDDLLKTLHLMDEIAQTSENIYFIGPQIFRPYPGSELYREAEKLGFRSPEDLEGWADSQFTEEGYLDVEALPWMGRDADFYRLINVSAPIIFNLEYLNLSPLKKKAYSMLRRLLLWRLRNDKWKFPIEIRLHQSLKKMAKLLTSR